MDNQVIQQAPTYIPVLTDSAGFWVQVVLAVITFLAVIVALFQEKIKDFFNSARLKLEINLKPPDCHQIDLTNQVNGQFISKCIYLRIRVTNVWGKTATNVEIMAANMWKLKSNKEEAIKSFLPMNLRWSHLHRVAEAIPPKSFRFCDLGAIRPLNGKVVLWLDTIAQPNPVSGGVIPNRIEAGEYKLELLISGGNTNPEVTSWKIKFSDQWSDDENEMMKRIRISKL